MPAVETRSGRDVEQRAESPRIPAPTRELERAAEERNAYIADREQVERRSVLRGLLVLAILAIVLSILRAGLSRVFPHGW